MNGKGLKGTKCTNNSPELGQEKNINDNVRMSESNVKMGDVAWSYENLCQRFYRVRNSRQ